MTTLNAIGFTTAGSAIVAMFSFLFFSVAVRIGSPKIAPRCTARPKETIFNPKAKRRRTLYSYCVTLVCCCFPCCLRWKRKNGHHKKNDGESSGGNSGGGEDSTHRRQAEGTRQSSLSTTLAANTTKKHTIDPKSFGIPQQQQQQQQDPMKKQQQQPPQEGGGTNYGSGYAEYDDSGNPNQPDEENDKEHVQFRGGPMFGWIPWTLSLSYEQLLQGVPGTGTRKNGMEGSMLKVNLDGIVLLRFHGEFFVLFFNGADRTKRTFWQSMKKKRCMIF